MADDPKPGFFGKKPAAPPSEVKDAAATPSPIPAAAAVAGTTPGFFRPRSSSPEPNPPAPAMVEVIQPPALPRTAGDRALAEQYLQQGAECYDRQETEQALIAYEKCVQADPSFAQGHNNLAMVLIDVERYEDALLSLFETIRLDANYAEAYNNLGFVYRRLERQIEAASAYVRFLELEPGVDEAPRIKGWVDTLLMEQNLPSVPSFVLPQSAQPVTAPVPAPVQDPPKLKKMAAWEAAAGNIATAAPVSAMGEIGEANPQPPSPAAAFPPQNVPAVKPAIVAPPAAPVVMPAPKPAAAATAQKPARPAARDLIAVVESAMDQFAEGNLNEAAGLFREAIQINPNDAEGHIGLGKVLVRQEKMKEGIEALQQAVQIDPKDPAAYYVLGFGLRAVERNIEAAEAYETFLALMPDALDSGKMREWIQHVKGIAVLRANVGDDAAAEDDGTDGDGDNEQIVTESDKKYKKVLTKFQEGNLDISVKDCIKLLTEDAAHYRTRVLLGRAYLRQKFYDKAIEQLEGALVTRPDYPEALYFLSQTAEKNGSFDKAITSVKRYMEVAPTGPRAERLRDWLITHGAPGSGGTQQAQCELCLRFFPESEMTQHEDKATCRNCMAVMGGAPEMSPTVAFENEKSADDETAAPVTPAISVRMGRSKGVALIGAFMGIAAVLGALFYLGQLNPVLKMLGIKIPGMVAIGPGPKPIQPLPLPPPPGTTWVFPADKVKVQNEPDGRALPFALWTYTPKLTGVKELDERAPGWKIAYALKAAPKDMKLSTDTLSWTPSLSDESLEKGASFPIELIITGSGKGPDGAQKNFFSIDQQFNVSCQFAYALGPELDLGLTPNDRVALAVGDLNGDGHPDAVICTGQYRQGDVRLYLQQAENPFPAPTPLASHSRFSALYVGDLDGNKKDDVIVADWQHGRIKLFYQDAQPIAGPELPVGMGPVAISAKTIDGQSHIATLLGAGGMLAITTLSADRKFGEVVNVPVPNAGGHGFVLPWDSAEAGPGFLAIAPLADEPLQFVPWNKGKWNKNGAQGPIASALMIGEKSNGDEGMIVAAVSLSRGATAPRCLALIVNGATSRLLTMEEKAGKFAPIGEALILPEPGLGLLAYDFNHDGQDDALVVMQQQCGFYFSNGGQLSGPKLTYKTPPMLGAAALFSPPAREGAAIQTPFLAGSPEILLIDEARKAHLMKPLSVVVAPVALDNEIKLDRIFKKGMKFHLSATGDNKDLTVLSVPDAKKKIKILKQIDNTFRVELEATAEVLEADPKGITTKIAYTLEKCDKINGEHVEEIVPVKKVVVAEVNNTETVYRVDNKILAEDKQEALELVIGTDTVFNDDTFGTKTRQKAGGSWPISKEGAARNAKALNLGDKVEVSGSVRMNEILKIGEMDCMKLFGELSAKNYKPKVLRPNEEVNSGELKMEFTQILPMESSLPYVLNSASTQATFKGTSDKAKNTTLEVTRERTHESKRTFLKN